MGLKFDSFGLQNILALFSPGHLTRIHVIPSHAVLYMHVSHKYAHAIMYQDFVFLCYIISSRNPENR